MWRHVAEWVVWRHTIGSCSVCADCFLKTIGMHTDRQTAHKRTIECVLSVYVYVCVCDYAERRPNRIARGLVDTDLGIARLTMQFLNHCVHQISDDIGIVADGHRAGRRNFLFEHTHTHPIYTHSSIRV